MEINDLKSQLNMQKMSQAASLQDALNKKELEIAQKDQLIAGLTARLNAGKQEIELAVAKVVNEKQQELNNKEQSILQLTSAIENGKKESELREQTLITQYEEKLKFKDEEIERYKDFKLRQSTKMVGESLEQHCEIEFNKLRMTGFANAYFEKDNDARTGSKGDYIYREADEDGTEFISIMFEMKNEMDATSTKKKNEDFLRNLIKTAAKKLRVRRACFHAGIRKRAVQHRHRRCFLPLPQNVRYPPAVFYSHYHTAAQRGAEFTAIPQGIKRY